MLLKTPNKIGRAARKLWGRGVLSYNKSGSARGLDQIENVFLVAGKKRYIVSASVPWYRSHAEAAPSLRKLNRLGYKALKAVEALSTHRVSIQSDAGLPIQVQVSPQHSTPVLLKGSKHAASDSPKGSKHAASDSPKGSKHAASGSPKGSKDSSTGSLKGSKHAAPRSSKDSKSAGYQLDVLVRGATSLKGWIGQQPLSFLKKAPGLFVSHFKVSKPGRNLLVLRAHNGDHAIAYRSVAVSFPKQPSQSRCLSH